ncbi:hypothetical protein RRG08_056131 [Elysia crispata]|uniref:Methyltransferase domain-containing protein n=1 Tax=Elysia crispata TaxID=231223 RepID=A0AAE0YVD3_9GAST|nr:hypothetical protein RRG08_056131 [Elysia crispata]
MFVDALNLAPSKDTTSLRSASPPCLWTPSIWHRLKIRPVQERHHRHSKIGITAMFVDALNLAPSKDTTSLRSASPPCLWTPSIWHRLKKHFGQQATSQGTRTATGKLQKTYSDSFWFPGEIIMADKTEEQTAFLRKSFVDPKVGMVGTTQTYDQLADQYDQVVAGYEYRAHHRVVDRLVSLVGDRNRAEMKIMDLGCGTGLVGEVL